jgi:hypothetical protein
MEKPLAIDLYCGLGGWAEGFLSEGYRVIGFDIEAHDYGTGGYPGRLVLRDVRSIHGAELIAKYGIPAVMVGSSPCQEFSYRAMPWKRAKALPPPYLGMELFQAQFRIQREASEAAGQYIPLIVENVRGAQKWVGQARWHFGSYFLWGDVPALMPPVIAEKFNPDGSEHGIGSWFAVADSKNRGARKVAIYSDPRRIGGKGSHLTSTSENLRRLYGEQPLHVSTGVRLPESGAGAGLCAGEQLMSDSQPISAISGGLSSSSGSEGVKQHGSGPIWFDTGIAKHSSRSRSRKEASALIAKIPFPLAQHIARYFKPESHE